MRLEENRTDPPAGGKSGRSADHKRWIRSVLLLAAVIALAIILRLPNLIESLWYDEVMYSTRMGVGNFGRLIRLTLYDTPAPFYRMFMLPWLGFFYKSELAVRLPSLIFGLSTIVLTYFIALELRDRKTALLSALFMTLSPVHVWYSQEATPYAMLLFFTLTAVLAFYRTTASQGNLWYPVYCVSIFLAVFTHFFASVFLVPLSILAFIGKRGHKGRILAANFVVLSCLILFLLLKQRFGMVVTGLGFLRPFTLLEMWMLFFNWFLTGNSIWVVGPYRMKLETLTGNPIQLTLQITTLLIFARGLLAPGIDTGNSRRLGAALLLFCLPFAFLILTLSGFRHLYIERYLMLVMPFFVIVLASGTLNMKKKATAAFFPAALLIIGLVSYIGFLSKGDQWTVYKQNPDWRSTARYLSVEFHKQDEAALVVTTPALALTYYLYREWREQPGRKRPKIYQSWKILKGDFKVAPRTNLFLIKNKFWTGGFNRLLERAKESRRLLLLSATNFKGVDIYKFRVLSKKRIRRREGRKVTHRQPWISIVRG